MQQEAWGFVNVARRPVGLQVKDCLSKVLGAMATVVPAKPPTIARWT